MPLQKKYIHRFRAHLIYQADFTIIQNAAILGSSWYDKFDSNKFSNAKFSGVGIVFEDSERSVSFEVNWKEIKIDLLHLGEADFEKSIWDVYPQFGKVKQLLEDVFKHLRTDNERSFKHLVIEYQLLKEIQTSKENLKKLLSEKLLTPFCLEYFNDAVCDPLISMEVPSEDNGFRTISLGTLSRAEHKKFLGTEVYGINTDCQIYMQFTMGLNRIYEDLESSDKMFSFSSKRMFDLIEKSYSYLSQYYDYFVKPLRREN